jgi:hypothetical protein
MAKAEKSVMGVWQSKRKAVGAMFWSKRSRIHGKFFRIWWTWSGSNRRPLPCHLRNINHMQTF